VYYWEQQFCLTESVLSYQVGQNLRRKSNEVKE
jgi:hypothetical protein